jgi:CRP/FNR family cyclic AMP-dependent transcriptional regulator
MPLDHFDNANPRADALGSDVAILESLSDAEQAEFLRFAEWQSVARGTRILTAGETGRSLYILVKGMVDVVVDGAKEPKTLASIGAGSIFGEMAFLDGHPRSAHVDAKEDVEILCLAPERFEQLAATHTRLAQQLLRDVGRILSLRLRRLNPAQ